MQSCSLFQTASKNQLESTQDLVKNFCIDQEGKARLSMASKSHTFSYESFIDQKAKSWVLLGIIPLHGEEELEIPLSGVSKFQDIKGSLISSVSKQSPAQRIMAVEFSNSVLNLVRLVEAAKSNKLKNFCELGQKTSKCTLEGESFYLKNDADKIKVLTKLKSGNKVLTSLENWKNFMPQRVSLKYYNTRSKKVRMTLDLYPTSCL